MDDDERFMESQSPHPAFRLYSPAVDFIENRLPQYHPAFDTRHVRFDPSQARFVPQMPPATNVLVPQSLSAPMIIAPGVAPLPQQLPRSAPGMINDMAFWQEIFPKAMELLKTEPAPSSVTDPAWGIRLSTTWADVQAKLDVARQKYDFHYGSQHVGKFRRWVRSGLDNHTVNLQQGARLVPEVDIAKPVVGAIRVVLDAYRQASEVREEITTSFEDLPEVFEKIDFYLQTYPKDQNIIKASSNLVRAIFVAIENAVAFYTCHQAKRAGLAILSGPEYQKHLRQSLLSIKDCCSALESQANMSFAHRMSNDHTQMMQQNASILQENNIMQQVLGSIYQHVQISSVGMLYWSNLFNEVLPLLSDLQRTRQSRSPIIRTPSPLMPLIEAPPLWQPQDIWARLRIPEIDEEDLQHVVGQTELIIHEDRGRAQQMLGTRLFRNWMGSSGSARLLVHGNFRPPHDAVSPLSVVCTLLTHTFRSSGSGFISLVFFCGRHLVWDEHQGGLAMIRSLIAQLLRQFPFASIQPDPTITLQDLERDDVNVLCAIFSLLVRQLPSNTLVFCLIDGISLYETEEYLHGMAVVIMSLIQLVDQGIYVGRPSFKLLITSPQPTLEVRQAFDSEPDALLHLQNLPMSGRGMDISSVQERLVSDMALGPE